MASSMLPRPSKSNLKESILTTFDFPKKKALPLKKMQIVNNI